MSTPLMEQYLKERERHPGKLLLFQMGDFFETFFDDAATLSRVLGITLTSRDLDRETGDRIPLAGFPVHALDNYLPRLIRAGFRIAICEQTEDPSKAKKLVRREVTEIITPGTLVSGQALGERETALLASLHSAGDRWAAAFCDLSTGSVDALRGTRETVLEELVRRAPREILVQDDPAGDSAGAVPPAASAAVSVLESWRFGVAAATDCIRRRLRVSALEGLGLEDAPEALGALGALLSYVEDVKRSLSASLEFTGLYSPSDILVIDRTSALALDLVDTSGPDREVVLADATDRTSTPGGGRMYRNWLLSPPRDRAEISSRYDAVEELLNTGIWRGASELLASCCDLERQAGRLMTAKSTPRDLYSIGATAALLPGLVQEISSCGSVQLAAVSSMDTLDDLGAEIRRVLVPDPPAKPGGGDTIAKGVSAELDELREARHGGRSWLSGIEEKERRETGIQKLSIGFNRVFGYYIEVPRSMSGMVPDRYVRRQTLTGSERYSTPELREMESKILRAEEGIERLEREMVEKLRGEVAAGASRIRNTGMLLSRLDVFCGMARLASERAYVRPVLADSPCFRLEDGRHPVLDLILPSGECVPNSIRMDADRRILIITGPNMAGKSTLLRQAAQTLTMAQAGSFVPAASFAFSPVDRLFTRIGSADRLARGQSTFLLEMADAAAVLNQSTPESFAVIDEMGRGTSTYDGLALAGAILESLHDSPVHRPLVLFATHYHELTRLPADLKAAANLNVPVKETRSGIVFLYRAAEGPADRSYGIHVAAMAGVPPAVTARAARILARLEKDGLSRADSTDGQMSMDFDSPSDALVQLLRSVSPDTLTPREAQQILYELRGMID